MDTDFKTAELEVLYSWLESETGFCSRYEGLTPVAPANTSQDFTDYRRALGSCCVLDLKEL